MGMVGQRLSSPLETAREGRLMKGKPITMEPTAHKLQFWGSQPDCRHTVEKQKNLLKWLWHLRSPLKSLCSCMCSELTIRCYWETSGPTWPTWRSLRYCQLGWSIEGSTIKPAVPTGPVPPQALLDIVNCTCTTEGKACSGRRCSCNKSGLSYTYCKCEGGVTCRSPFTSKQAYIEDDGGELDVDDEEFLDSWLLVTVLAVSRS